MAVVNFLSPRHLFLTSPFLQKLFICVQRRGCFCCLFFFCLFFLQRSGQKKTMIERYKNLSSLAPHWRNWLIRPNRASNNWSPRVGPYHTSHTLSEVHVWGIREEKERSRTSACFSVFYFKCESLCWWEREKKRRADASVRVCVCVKVSEGRRVNKSVQGTQQRCHLLLGAPSLGKDTSELRPTTAVFASVCVRRRVFLPPFRLTLCLRWDVGMR